MKRVASLYLPNLSIERLRRTGRALQPDGAGPTTSGEGSAWLPSARLPGNGEERAKLAALRDRLQQEAAQMRAEDCSCPRNGGWRPGARWASREERQTQIDALPAHQRPPMRMLGRRSEAAETPFRGRGEAEAAIDRDRWIPAAKASSPFVTIHRFGQRVVLAAVSPEAAALGLHPGMPATQARALVPGLEMQEADPAGDRAFLTRLALFAARRWTPCAALSEPDGLWLDFTGIAPLFGGERRLCERILRYCARLGFSANIAVAGTTGATHALARFTGGRITLCPNGGEAEAIATLPPIALRLDEQSAAACRRFGIESIGELMAMPRSPLARRFGARLLMRLDQALGRIGEPFDPIVPEEPPSATLRFLEPILSAEAIEQVLGDLLDLLTGKLASRGLGARQITLLCDRIDGEIQSLTIGTASATRDPGHLLRLLNMKIERIEPGFGIEAMTLVAGRFEPLSAKQTASSLGSDCGASDLPQLVDRIACRIGSRQLFRCSAVESDVPERSVERVAALEPTADWPRDLPRPVRLLRRPERVDKVIAELPDQPPLRFWWRGEMHRVRKADGPERIHGEWWKHSAEAHRVRDYFQVEDDSGARFWLFRRGDGVDPRTGDLSWYIHGVFG